MLCLFSMAMAAGTFTVDDLGDAPDVTPGDGVCATAENFCTLRAAIVEANAIPGGDTIHFSVAGTISPATDLPTVLQRLTIDGTSAPDYAGTPVLVLDGGEVLSIGLNFGATASASRLIGLKIIGFAASGVNITASNMEVQHNHIGPIGGGTANFDGIVVAGTGNHIGTGESAGNVISGNANDGVVLSGSGHRLLANRIGTTPDGMSALGNGCDGIKVFDSATNIFIGGERSLADHHNVVAANGDDGIDLQNASNVTIGGNDVGYDQATQTTIANADNAIELTSSYDNTLSVPDDNLTVSGHEPTGIRIVSGTGNVIGLGLTGDASCVGNGTFETAEPAQNEPVAETIIVATTNFNELEPAPAAVKPTVTPPAPLPVSSRASSEGPGRAVRETRVPSAAATAQVPTPTARVPRPALPGPSLDARDDKRIAIASPITAKAAAAVPKEDPLPIAPAPAASMRSRLGLMLLAAGTAFAALLRMIR